MRPNLSGTARAIFVYLAIVYVATSALVAEPDRYRYSTCAKMGRPNFAISKKPFDGAAKASTPSVHTVDVDLSFDHILEIRGRGATCAKGLIASSLLLANGSVYAIKTDGTLTSRDRNISPYIFRAEQNGPNLNGHGPISVAALSLSEYNHERVGIWAMPKKSAIALFEAGKTAKGTPRIVGTSKIPVRDVNYFPAPDAPTGMITVIRDIAPDHVEIWVGELRTKPFVR